MKKHNQKGFTIVELIIVIAVIAILAAVLIPTFSNIVKKANLSNDQQNVRNMNTALAVEVIPNSKFEYAGDAITGLYAEGWNMGKLETYSTGYHYAYSLENNRMYLLDEVGTVVYPEESVDKSTLWGLWKNTATDMSNGITKYISLVNINGGYYATHFAEGTYAIDLQGHYINYTGGTLENVTVLNGIFISGATKAENEDIVELEQGVVADVQSGESTSNVTVIEDKVFDLSGNESLLAKKNITFKNCFFYNANEPGSVLGNRTFENCTFIDSVKYIFNLQTTGSFDGFLTVKGCTFINCNRVFNIPVGVYGQTADGTITIDGNTFYASRENDRSTCQFNTMGVNSPVDKTKEFKYLDITFSNNTYVECATTQAGLFTLNSATLYNENITLSAEHITFVNNTVASSIDSSKYIVNDDGKADSAINANQSYKDFKAALIQKFNEGKK